MNPLVFFGIVFLLCALILCVGACMRSSQMSREEDIAATLFELKEELGEAFLPVMKNTADDLLDLDIREEQADEG